jgi:hypothetical protein
LKIAQLLFACLRLEGGDGNRFAVGVETYHGDSRGVGVALIARLQVFCIYLDRDLHAGAPDVADVADHRYKLSYVDGLVEVHAVEAGGDADSAGVLGACGVGAQVDHLQNAPAEDFAKKVGVVGLHDLRDLHAGFGDGLGGHRQLGYRSSIS